MHRAPAVRFSVTQSRWHLRAIIAVGLLALACAVFFVSAQSALDWRVAALGGLIPLVLAYALHDWRHAARGILDWDGQQWHWSGFSAAQTCQLSLRMDFQSLALVAIFSEPRKPVYLWLEAAMDPAHWRALRRAIVSSQRMAGPEVDTTMTDASGAHS